MGPFPWPIVIITLYGPGPTSDHVIRAGTHWHISTDPHDSIDGLSVKLGGATDHNSPRSREVPGATSCLFASFSMIPSRSNADKSLCAVADRATRAAVLFTCTDTCTPAACPSAGNARRFDQMEVRDVRI